MSEDFVIPPATHTWSDYELIHALASGAFGRVLCMKQKDNNKQVVIKRVPYVADEEKMSAKNEVKKLIQAQSNHVVQFLEAFIYDIDLCIVMEFSPGRTLYQFDNMPLIEIISQIPQTYDVIEELGASSANRTKHIREQGLMRDFILNEIQSKSEQQSQEIEKQLTELERLKNPHIIRYIGHKQNGLIFTLFSEYVDGGDALKLSNDLRSSQHGFSTSQVYDFISQIATALDFIHKKGIIFRKLKPHKIMITKDGKIFKLTGLEPKFDQPVNTSLIDNSGSICNYQHLNPEALQNQPETDKSNIFCLGLIAYKLVELKDAFTSNNEKELKQRIISGRPEQFTHVTDGQLQKLILQMLEKDQTKRISAEQILTFPEVSSAYKDVNNFLNPKQKKLPPVPPPSQPQLVMSTKTEPKQNQFRGIMAVTKQKTSKAIAKEQQIKNQMKLALLLQSQLDKQLVDSQQPKKVEDVQSPIQIQDVQQQKLEEDVQQQKQDEDVIQLKQEEDMLQIKQDEDIYQIKQIIEADSEDEVQSNEQEDEIKLKEQELLKAKQKEQEEKAKQPEVAHPHPYFAVIEQQQIIKVIVQNMLLNEEVDILIKKKAWELLDALYPEGIKLPPKYQTETVSAIIAGGGIDIAVGNIKKESEGKDVD
ncbi:MAG: putative serine/threonine-protein kinase Nek1, partial [Streblomastix strix]